MKWVSQFRKFYAFGCGKDQSSLIVISHRSSVSGVTITPKKLCVICLDAMCHVGVFTAECSHEFHCSCIESNVRHGSNTCPICRATWTHLPRNPNQVDIRYEDDDPVDFDHSIISLNECPLNFSLSLVGCSDDHYDRFAYLSVRLSSSRAPTDLVLVFTGNEMRLGTFMQAIALVVSYLGPSDRLAVVALSRRVVRLRRMTPRGKRGAMRAISGFLRNKVLGNGNEDLKTGMKILSDRVYKNPASLILSLSDVSGRSLRIPNISMDLQVAMGEYNFRGMSDRVMMGDFGVYLECLLGDVIRGLEVRMGNGERWMVGNVRVNFERMRMVNLGTSNIVRLSYRYIGGTAGPVFGEKLLPIERGKQRFLGFRQLSSSSTMHLPEV